MGGNHFAGLTLLSRSTLPVLVALAAMVNACALPAVNHRTAADYGHHRVRTVALLPVDISLRVDDPQKTATQARQLQDEVIKEVSQGLSQALARQGYRVITKITPDGMGHWPGRGRAVMVIHPTDLAEVRLEIQEATRQVGEGPLNAGISVDLSRQLGRGTGADASLFARSWIYLAPEDSDKSKAAAVILIVLLAILTVGIVIALVASKGKGGGGLKGGGAKGMSKAALGAARAARAFGRVSLRSAPFVLGAMAEASRHHAVHCHRCDTPGPAPPPPPRVLVLREDNRPPKKSTLGFYISLLHNNSGRILWHASQEVELRVDQASDVESLAQHFLKHLPRTIK